jgi:hypothetical protein
MVRFSGFDMHNGDFVMRQVRIFGESSRFFSFMKDGAYVVSGQSISSRNSYDGVWEAAIDVRYKIAIFRTINEWILEL